MKKRKKKLKLIVGIAPWHDSNNRRKFFEEYARDHSFDPLIPDHWYVQPFKRIMAREVLLISNNNDD